MVSHLMLCGFGDSLDSLLLVWVFLFVVVFHLFVLCSSGFLSAGFLLKSPDIVKKVLGKTHHVYFVFECIVLLSFL